MRTLLTALALVPLTLGLAACGGDDEEGRSGPAVNFKKGQVVKVTGLEYRFSPGTIVIGGGAGPVKFEFQNGGSLAHNLRVMEGAKDLGGTPTFAAGEKRSATVNLKTGVYEMVCTVGDHSSLGMVGQLTIK